MELAWTADDSSVRPPEGRTTPSPALRRLSAAWDATADSGIDVDREVGMRRLYERTHADMVRFAAFLTGDVGRAEDVAQDAFAKVFDAWDRIDDLDKIDAYLKATVVNLVRGSWRRQQVADRQPEPQLRLVPSAEEDAIAELRRRRTLDAVSALPLRQRACVVMRHWMRMSESEIADTLGVSVGSVRTHVKRGTETLRNTLGAPS